MIYYEEKVELRNGELIVETRLHPVFDVQGNITHLLGVAQDITEQKRLEEELRKSNERIQRLLKIARIGTALMDIREGRILETDTMIQLLLGYTEEELRIQSFSKITFPDDTQPNMIL